MEEGASNDHADNGHIPDDDENKEMLKMALSSYHPLKGEEEAPPLFCPKCKVLFNFQRVFNFQSLISSIKHSFRKTDRK